MNILSDEDLLAYWKAKDANLSIKERRVPNNE